MTEASLPHLVLANPRHGMGLRGRVAREILRGSVAGLPVRVAFPDGTTWGDESPGSPVLQVNDPERLFRRLGHDTKIGLGEAYMAGEWQAGPTTDLADLLTPFAERVTHLVPPWMQRFRSVVDQRIPTRHRNTVEGSRANIEAHYDLSNELFTRFLDPTLSYSAAWFAEGDDDLESAQIRKIDAILDDAGVTAGSRVLEIGSGWGSLAITAAQRGAHVTTVTLSREQADLARMRFAEAGVADRIDLQIRDYREVEGQYDAIVSVEMIEAVGEEYWPSYFSIIDRHLAPGGSVAIQAILMPHHRLIATRNSYGWIQKYIFPGGLIPSLTAIESTLADHTTLAVVGRRSLGADYARTLRQWRSTFLQNWPEIRPHGFDETFRRMWEFYLAYCEAGFRSGYLDVEQLKIARRA